MSDVQFSARDDGLFESFFYVDGVKYALVQPDWTTRELAESGSVESVKMTRGMLDGTYATAGPFAPDSREVARRRVRQAEFQEKHKAAMAAL